MHVFSDAAAWQGKDPGIRASLTRQGPPPARHQSCHITLPSTTTPTVISRPVEKADGQESGFIIMLTGSVRLASVAQAKRVRPNQVVTACGAPRGRQASGSAKADHGVYTTAQRRSWAGSV